MDIIKILDFIIFPVIIIISLLFMGRKHPKGLFSLFFTEMWERFGFYTMLAILALYMDEFFNLPKDTSGKIYGLFLGFVYFTPLLGGLIADKLWGFSKTIIIGAIVMMAGYALMAVKDINVFYLALAVIVIGNGLFKPNISVMVGNLYDEKDPAKDSGFNIFYMGINIGAFYAPSAASYMRSQFGWEYAFLIASAGMLVGLIIFLINRKKIKEADRTNKGVSEFVMQEPEPQDNKNRIIALSALFGIVILFWMAFHQNGYTLTFWARDCTMTNLKPELFQKANPFFVVLFTPLLIWFWSLLAGAKKEPSTPAKMGIGMLLTALSFLIMYLGAIKLSAMGEGGKVGVSWLLSAYAIVTMGELCLSPMGLSFVSKVAPPKIKGLMMGGWFAATAIGNYLSGYLGSFWEKISHKDFFLLLVISSLFGAVLLFMVMNLLIKALKGGNVAITGDVSGHHVTLSPEPPEEDNEIIKK